MAPKQTNKSATTVAAPAPATTPAVEPTPVQTTPAPAPAPAKVASTKKAASTKAAEPVVATPAPAPAPVSTPAPAPTKVASTKKAASTKAAEPVAPVVEVAPAQATETPAEVSSEAAAKSKPTKDSLNTEYDRLKKWLDDKLSTLQPKEEAPATNADGTAAPATNKKRKRAPKGLGIKDVRYIKKTIEQMQKDHIKVTKIKNPNRKNNTSGLKVEVELSDELYDFCGFEKGTLHSRVDVNKKLNQYVKEHNLQNPKDGREIFPDTKLKALLRIEAGDNTAKPYWFITKASSCHYKSKPKTTTTA